MQSLMAPLALVEDGDCEFQFYESIEAMLSNPSLWGERYSGIDSSGCSFSLVSREDPRRWWHVLFNQDHTRLVIEAASTCAADALYKKLSRFLKCEETDLKQLIALGIAQSDGAGARSRLSANGHRSGDTA